MQFPSRDQVPPAASALEWHTNHLRLLDHRSLPEARVWVECRDADEVADAIVQGVVPGAAAGVVAAYGIALAARRIGRSADWLAALKPDLTLLAGSSPASAQLGWVLGVVIDRLQRLPSSGADVPELLAQLAMDLHLSDREAARSMGQLGLQVFKRHASQSQRLLAMPGNLASGSLRGLLELARAAHGAGLMEHLHLCADQDAGALRLARWALEQDGVPVSAQVLAAAGQLMKGDNLHWVVVGAQRVAANGDVISDLGTYALAVLAMHHGLRFMVVAPSSAFDVGLEDADEIEPEDALLQRDGRLQLDVTPAELIDVLVTERGVVERPDAGRIAELLSPLRLH